MCFPPNYLKPQFTPLDIHQRGYFFQNTQNLNKGFKIFNCPTLLVRVTSGTPLAPSGAKTHFCPLLTLPGCKNLLKKTQSINRGFKTLDYPTILVGYTSVIPLAPSGAKTHFCPIMTLPGCKPLDSPPPLGATDSVYPS